MNYKSFEESKVEDKVMTDKALKQHSKWIEIFNVLHKNDCCLKGRRKEE